NRRFLMAGTAYGNISTDNASLQDPPPPNGTIFDQLSAHGISWRNYFTDLPSTGIIPSIIEKHPSGLAPISSFFADCAAGTPPSAVAPDTIPPELGPNDIPGGYDIYGPRVPTVVVSPYSKPRSVTNVVHDHTSILATIEHKWNLPPLTKRDAAAATLADFLDTSRPALLEPPALAEPGELVSGEENCDT